MRRPHFTLLTAVAVQILAANIPHATWISPSIREPSAITVSQIPRSSVRVEFVRLGIRPTDPDIQLPLEISHPRSGPKWLARTRHFLISFCFFRGGAGHNY